VSFHPNDVQRRARTAGALLGATFLFLLGAFFRTQIVENKAYALQSEENRLSEVPLPAPRGMIYDRHGEIIAENLPGYSVSILSPSADSLRAQLKRLSGTIQLGPEQIEVAVRRWRRAGPNRPTTILADAPFDVISVLEEHRVEFPALIIQSTPKRFYPNGRAVASFVGYTGEITESELNSRQFRGYKAGQQVGKGGLEKQYETELRGKDGARFVEVDARGSVVREAGARPDLLPEAAPPLYTNIDLKLQLLADSLFGDTLQGGVIAVDPRSGEVLAMHSAPSFDPNRFVGGIPVDYWRELNTDPRKPLYNKVIQGRYPPGSTFKLATTLIALEDGVIALSDHMPTSCTGGMYFGSRYFRCWEKKGHGNLSLSQAIAKSCDVYFYQLGLKLGLSRLLAGGVSLDFGKKSGIDLPNEATPIYPYAVDYYNKRYGPRGWTNAVSLNLSIGQGENSQTVVNMARFYTALATDGFAARPELTRRKPEKVRLFTLNPEQLAGVRAAMADVVSARGTAAGAQIRGVVIAGKTGTAQTGVFENGIELNHAWFTGFAPAEDPKIVIVVMLELVPHHGSVSARIASKLIERYLNAQAVLGAQTEGD
jgi:penicillin-binding protein 2